MTTFAQEEKQRSAEGKRAFIKRMKRDDPFHARLYCDHGEYVGSNRMFLSQCEICSGEDHA